VKKRKRFLKKEIRKRFKKIVKPGIECLPISTNFQQIFFSNETMGSKNTIGPLANLQVKADDREKQKSGRKYKIACRKKPLLFYSLHHALGGRARPQGIACCLGGSWVASGDHGWPQGVRSSL
jgi:hypothetical protein